MTRRRGAALVGLWWCAAAGCAAAPPAAPVEVAVTSTSTPAAARPAKPSSADAQAARAVTAVALAPGAEDRWRRRRALTFSEGGARFALDDAWALVAQAPRPRRAALLAAMAPALAERAAVVAEEQALIAYAAGAAHTSAGALAARRVGLDERALADLVEEVMRATGELLGPVAADVTLVPDVLAPPPWLDRGTPSSAIAAPHGHVTAWALHYGDVPRPPTPDDAAAYARALTVELRLAALSVAAMSAPPATHDALASRALAADAELVPGAAALLELDPSGAVVERFVGLLRAPAVASARWANEPLATVVTRLEQAPPPDEEGYPEAFVAVARLLPELQR